MNDCRYRPIALADSKAVRQVPAYGRGPHEGARSQRRNSVKAARSKSWCARSQRVARRMDDGAAVSRHRHGRGFVYFGQLINPSTALWAAFMSFLIGMIVALLWWHGAATLDYALSW